ncbi:hypothetical protein HUT18_21685 [Streptomyces sp. NA04227]|uniref:hypothetical protein n=1 Tax=Streptomyces sp. NA04227 TaxID=2742136 RepID=UPI0015921965|nr:hypothetical protein [Streptomyces sp. NA04227]QKW08590.1 hypothetical protein HUT18_21685 [Streptomyces sp. NA04227]
MSSTQQARLERAQRLDSDESNGTVPAPVHVLPMLWMGVVGPLLLGAAALLWFSGQLASFCYLMTLTSLGPGSILVRLGWANRAERALSRRTRRLVAAQPHPAYSVRLGLNASDGRAPGPVSELDVGPAQDGVCAVGPEALYLVGVDGREVTIPLAELRGAVQLPRSQGSLDIHLRDGQSLELKAAHPRNFLIAVCGRGVRMLWEGEVPHADSSTVTRPR